MGCPRPASEALYVVVQGTMREGLRHGLWVFVDHRGELVQLELFRWGFSIGRVLPYRSEDDQRMERVLKEQREK